MKFKLYSHIVLTNMSKSYAKYILELGFFLKILGAEKGYW